MMFGIGLMHFANFQHIKDAKHVFQGAKKFRTKYTHSTPLKDRNGKPERGSEWEPIKILLEGDRGSNKMNTVSNTRLRVNYQSWSRPRNH
jgi:hypothetical protein